MVRPMRRKKQELSREDCDRVLVSGKRGVLSLFGEDGYPYGIPMNYWYSKEEETIYFHGAKEGYKLDCLKKNPKASFCVYDEGYRKPGDWALNIKSVVAFGEMSLVEDEEKAKEICSRLTKKFTDDEDYLEKELKSSLAHVQCLALKLKAMTGKEVNES